MNWNNNLWLALYGVVALVVGYALGTANDIITLLIELVFVLSYWLFLYSREKRK